MPAMALATLGRRRIASRVLRRRAGAERAGACRLRPVGPWEPVCRRADRCGRGRGRGPRGHGGGRPVRRGRLSRERLRPTAPGVGAEPVGDLLRGGPLLGLFGQQPEQIRVEGGGDLHPCAAAVGPAGCRHAGTASRSPCRSGTGLPEQQLIDDAAQGVHVGGRVGGTSQGALGGQVEAGADDVTRRRQRGGGIVDELGDPEVADLHRTVRVQHEVARLDVAVNDPWRCAAARPAAA